MVICRRSVRCGGQVTDGFECEKQDLELNWVVLLNRSDVVDGGGLGHNPSS